MIDEKMQLSMLIEKLNVLEKRVKDLEKIQYQDDIRKQINQVDARTYYEPLERRITNLEQKNSK